jgi:tRNA dimethylallyltransferase
MDKLLIITGQTACGKTDLAFELAKKYNGEIISFDSRQAYKYLDIITGKEKNLEIKTWMIDEYDPKEIVSSFDYCQKAEKIIQDIISRKKLPIIVGGTVFYIKSFLYGISDFTDEPDWDLRNELENNSVKELQDILKEMNIEKISRMNNSDVNNKRRLIRAIEISKSQFSNINKNLGQKNKDKFNFLIIGMMREKIEMENLIHKRILKRISSGAFEEIDGLLKLGYLFSDPGLNTIGYKQLRDFYEEKISKEEAILNWERQEIDYARRQLVFMKKLESCNIFNLSEKDNLEKIYELVYKWQYAKS